jgi:hypothetical protein
VERVVPTHRRNAWTTSSSSENDLYAEHFLRTSLTIIGVCILRKARDAPESRRKQLEQEDDLIERLEVGGLRRHYERRAA